MDEGFSIFQTVAGIIILVLGTIGNVLVVLVIVRRRKMRTVTNYLILNLAIADLTVLISNIPIDLTTEFMDRWVFGKMTCKIIKPLQTMGTSASMLTLVTISLSRYHAIVYPFHRQMKLSHARVALVAIWIISLAGITPYALACKYDPTEQKCGEDFESIGMSPKAFTFTMFVLQYVIPMIGMTYAYNRIAVELSHQQCSECGTSMDPEYRRETKKVVKMLSIVVAVFAVLVLPFHIVWIWYDFSDETEVTNHEYIKNLALIMLYGNSIINPIIYSICNDQFRTGFRKLFGSCLEPCNVLMKITGLAKSDPDRTCSPSANHHIFLHDSARDRRAMANGYNRDTSRENRAHQEMERLDSGCTATCTKSNRHKTTTGACKSEIEVTAYVSAV